MIRSFVIRNHRLAVLGFVSKHSGSKMFPFRHGEHCCLPLGRPQETLVIPSTQDGAAFATAVD